MSLYRPPPVQDPEPDDFTLPPRLLDGRLVPVGLDPVRLARERARRARWGALRAVPGHGAAGKTMGAKERL